MGHTVYVIGAGASSEANLPFGSQFMNHISRALDLVPGVFGDKEKGGDPIVYDALRIHASQNSLSIKSLTSKAQLIRRGLPHSKSIDNFIDSHRDDAGLALCGKLAIVREILMAERRSKLYFERLRVDTHIKSTKITGTWYQAFMQLLNEACTKDEIAERLKSISLIIFNYDRCVEHFLFWTLQTFYNIKEEEAAEIMQNIRIYHPYGSCGRLPWQPKADPHNIAVDFGSEPNPQQLLNLADQIKTFTESTEPVSVGISELHNEMLIATRLVFLGFAYHKLNMALLTPPTGTTGGPTTLIQCFATTKGISQSDQTIVEYQIRKLYTRNVRSTFFDGGCGDFFDHFRKSLEF